MAQCDKPDTADNAEESIKCLQCGNMFGVAKSSGRKIATCPMCGSTQDIADVRSVDASDEEY